jgi:hypothetical protein
MILNVYIDDECAYSLVEIDKDNLTDLQKLFLQNPIILNLEDIGVIPKLGSGWDGNVFTEIDNNDYQSFVNGTDKTYFAVVVENKVVEILNYNTPREIAIMSSNPVVRLEDRPGTSNNN